MIIRRKVLLRRFILLGLLVVCFGCGGSGGGSEGATDHPDPAHGPTPPAAPQTLVWDPADFDHVYDVGPGQPFADPSAVPWESLLPSSLVRIFYRDTPYRTKFVIATLASADAPVVVLGVPDGNRLPVISGDQATTRAGMYYLNEGRSVIKVGNYTGPQDVSRPAHVYIQNLDIRSARPGYSFVDRRGAAGAYSNNAAAVHIEEGDHITIVGCDLHDCGNGLFSTHLTSDILIRENHIHNNGIDGRIFEHNSYTESRGIVFEYNHYGPLRQGCLGNNLKDRSSGTVIRYNWIESGNRQLDLVETEYGVIFEDPAYDETFVYGNVLLEMDGAGNRQVVHYGGDGDDTAMYRQGILYFYHNTVVSLRTDETTLLRLSTNRVRAQVHNNILFAAAGGDRLAVSAGNGQMFLENNWLPMDWQDAHGGGLEPGASVSDLGNPEGTQPGFSAPAGYDYHLADGADAADAGGPLPADTERYPVRNQYVTHQAGTMRHADGSPDAGAFEH